MLRIIRIALLALVPMLALGTLAVGCGDDTTTMTTTGPDLSATTHPDMAHGDMSIAQTD